MNTEQAMQQCPFCGSMNVKPYLYPDDSYCQCADCFTTGPSSKISSNESAIALWNTRAAQASIATPQPQSVVEDEPVRFYGDDWVSDVILKICELSDRNSPEGFPEAMVVTAAELRQFITQFAPKALIEPLSAATCVCGDPQAPNTVHRKYWPCYQVAATGGQESEALDTVEPDAFLNDNGNVMSSAEMEKHASSANWAWVIDKHWTPSKRLYTETKVEALLAECRKQARKEILGELINIAESRTRSALTLTQLRSMAEGEK